MGESGAFEITERYRKLGKGPMYVSHIGKDDTPTAMDLLMAYRTPNQIIRKSYSHARSAGADERYDVLRAVGW